MQEEAKDEDGQRKEGEGLAASMAMAMAIAMTITIAIDNIVQVLQLVNYERFDEYIELNRLKSRMYFGGEHMWRKGSEGERTKGREKESKSEGPIL